MSENTCKYIKCWQGRCQHPAVKDEYCEEHKDKRCCACGAKSTHNCAETMGPFVCGAELCDDCNHHVGPNGTNQNGTHGRKGTGRYKSWLEMSEQELAEGKFHQLVWDYIFDLQCNEAFKKEIESRGETKEREKQTQDYLRWLKASVEEIGSEKAKEIWTLAVSEKIRDSFFKESKITDVPFPF